MMVTTVPESLIRVFPAWAYCQLWLSSTAIVNHNQCKTVPKPKPVYTKVYSGFDPISSRFLTLPLLSGK